MSTNKQNLYVEFINSVIPADLKLDEDSFRKIIQDIYTELDLKNLFNTRISNLIILLKIVENDNEKFISEINEVLRYLIPNYRDVDQFNFKLIKLINSYPNYKVLYKLLFSKFLTKLTANYDSNITIYIINKYFSTLTEVKNRKDEINGKCSNS